MSTITRTTATFNRYVNDPTTSEQELHQRSGQRIVVLGEYSGVDYEPEETGRLYTVTFEDGYISEAFEEELTEWREAAQK